MIAALSFFRLLTGSRRWLAISTGLTIVQALVLLPIGLLFRRAFDETIPSGRTDELAGIAALLLGLAIASAGLGLWTRHVVLRVTKAAVAELRIVLLGRLHTLALAVRDRMQSAQVHATIVQDTERVDVIATVVAADLIPSAIIVIALSAALIVLNLFLFLLLVPAFLVMLLLAKWLGGKVTRRTSMWQRAFDLFSIRTQFALRAHSLVVTHGTQEAEMRGARAEIADLAETGRAMAWMHNAHAHATSGVGMVAAVTVLVVGGAAVAHDRMTIGSLVSFYALLLLLRGPLSTILYVIPIVISGAGSLERLASVMEADEPARYRGTRLPGSALPIELRAVHFGYQKDLPLLVGFDLEIRPGEWVALTGRNGAGKTTVGALILGLYRPSEGVLLANGVPYDDLDIDALRRYMAVVPQDPILFPGTIAENISYGDALADRARVRAAAHQANVDEFVRGLPRGYETEVGDDGTLLSGGQRQKIAIARALMRRPALLILDEPTAGLDREAVSSILQSLRDLPADCGVLLISHDPAVVAEADRVVVLEAGRAHALSPQAHVLGGG